MSATERVKAVFKGSEIKKLVLVSTLCCVLLIVSVSFFLIFSSRSNLRKQTDRMKTEMAEQIAEHLQGCYDSMAVYLKSAEGIELGSNVTDLLKNSDALYGFFASSIRRCYDADAIYYYTGDVLRASDSKPGVETPVIEPGIAGGNEYVVMNELGGRQGTFLVFDKQGALPGDNAVYVIDNTEQNAAIRQAYEDEKSSAIKRQVLGVGILFVLLMAFSLVVIYLSIARWLGRPMARLSRKARDIMQGQQVGEEEVREGSIFANLQRLLNSGRAILGRGTEAGSVNTGDGETVRQREISKVMGVWTAVTILVFLTSTVILLVVSIALTNSKTEEILNNVDQEMAGYYSRCYDSIVGYALSGSDIYVGGDLWDPNATVDREASRKRLVEFVRYTFDADSSVAYIEVGGVGKFFTSVKNGAELKEPLLEEMGDPINIYEDYYSPGDLVILNMERSEYPGFGEDQFAYYVVNVTPQADVLEGLYQEGTSSLLTSQLLLSLVFLLLCLALSPLAMAWATMRYVTRPILELDALSDRLMEGELDVEVTVDERSAFADIQRLLVWAQELLRSMT